MDVLVVWKDKTVNVVKSSELSVEKCTPLAKGTKVKMWFEKKWYSGTILDVEDNISDEFNSSDEEPLALLKNKLISRGNKFTEKQPLNSHKLINQVVVTSVAENNCEKLEGENNNFQPIDSSKIPKVCENTRPQDNNLPMKQSLGKNINIVNVIAPNADAVNENICEETEGEANNFQPLFSTIKNAGERNSDSLELEDIESVGYDSDRDPLYVATCEYHYCNEEVWAACHRCIKLLCFNHFDNNPSCNMHTSKKRYIRKSNKHPQKKLRFADNSELEKNDEFTPEQFVVEGEEKEGEAILKKRTNAQKLAKKLRNLGQEYVSPKMKKVMPARFLKAGCRVEYCKKIGRQCFLFSDDDRKQIFNSYNALGSLDRQREFILHHVETLQPKQKTTSKDTSRRSNTIRYFLTLDSIKIMVCKLYFLNTLGISDRTVRTAISKLTSVGMMEGERRGGRQSEMVRARDLQIRLAIKNHINRFPKVESHNCRASSSREYLHPDLTILKMFALFVKDLSDKDIPSIVTYRRVFNMKNLSFHHPKKDQCSLCLTFRQGDEMVKAKLEERYTKHISEKTAVRRIKEECKVQAKNDSSKKFLCATFDLQQVIYLPRSKESAIFYKRRLSNFNLTFYDIGTKECKCFTWYEAISRRGASEISTGVFNALQQYDTKGIQFASLFADGCSGQNKNTILTTMLLYAVTHFNNLKEINLRFFESNHGQSEGDSAHSAIGRAIENAGDIIIPSQLHPIITLARKERPYELNVLEHGDFLNFRKLSQSLRILPIKTTDTREKFKWTEIMELKVFKSKPRNIIFKTSHSQNEYSSITLKRNTSIFDLQLERLNTEPVKISKDKYVDLISLCSGDTPVIRLEEHKQFYRSLPHDE